MEGPLQLYVEGPLQLYVQGPLQLYVEGLLQLYVQGPLQLYVQGPLQLYVQGPLQLYVQGPLQLYVQGPLQLYVQGHWQEAGPADVRGGVHLPQAATQPLSSCNKQGPESQPAPGLGSLLSRHSQLRGSGCSLWCSRDASGTAELKDMRPHAHVAPTPPAPPLGSTCKGHSSPKAMERPEHSTGKHRLCFLFYFVFFKIPGASDSSLGIRAQKPSLTTYSPAGTLGQGCSKH